MFPMRNYYNGLRMKYARQINLPIDIGKIRVSNKSLGSYLVSPIWSEPASTHLYIRKKDKDLLAHSLPEKLKDYLFHIDANKFTLLAPHIHLNEQTVINIYLNVGGEITTFYEGLVTVDHTSTTDNGAGYNLINVDRMYPVESFCASAGEMWMLDTATTHDVSIKNDTRVGLSKYVPVDNNHRLAVQLCFNAPYAELSQFI